MKFSVITVNYRSWPYTTRCIGSLYATGYRDFDVVIVNNDQGAPPTIPHPVHLIRNSVNMGFAKACNQGVSASNGEYVILLNPDTIVQEGFFEGIARFLDQNPRAGVVGPRIVEADGNLQLSARKDPSLISGLLGRTSLLTRLLRNSVLVKDLFPAAQDLTEPTEVDWVSGACLTVRRRTLEEIGPLDERFFMYFEDADLCRRAREVGWHIYYLPQVEILHHSGASSRDRGRATWMLHKSAFLYHRKHGPHGPLGLYSLLTLIGLAGRLLIRFLAPIMRGNERGCGDASCANTTGPSIKYSRRAQRPYR